MQKETLNTTESLWEKVLHIFLFIYLFLLIFPHTITPREIAFWTASFCWVMLRLRKSGPFITLNPVGKMTLSNEVNPFRVHPITVSLAIFMIVAFISSVIGMEPLENLERFKGELVVPFILFLIIATEFNSIEKVKCLLSAPIIAFAIYTSLAIVESTNYGLQYFWDKTNREQYYWLLNYSQMAAIILPIMLGFFLLTRNIWVRIFLIIFAMVEFFILASYRSITPFLAVVSVIFVWILFAKPQRYRLLMSGFVLLIILIFSLFAFTYKDNPAVVEYRNKIAKIIDVPEEFKEKGGFSNRVPAWIAAIDIIKERPLLGYGWGIKKFEKLVYQKKFLEKWKKSKPSVYEFYTVTIKNALFPPHNMFLEIAVQSGLIGLAVFITFTGIYLFNLIKNAIRSSSDTDRNFSIILIGGTFLSFMIMNLMGNELGNVSGKVLFVVLGVGTAWMKGKPRQKA
jgi:O-antigen ligase